MRKLLISLLLVAFTTASRAVIPPSEDLLPSDTLFLFTIPAWAYDDGDVQIWSTFSEDVTIKKDLKAVLGILAQLIDDPVCDPHCGIEEKEYLHNSLQEGNAEVGPPDVRQFVQQNPFNLVGREVGTYVVRHDQA